MRGKTPWRIGLGPVFAYERIAASRRWQLRDISSIRSSCWHFSAALVLVWKRTAHPTATLSPLGYYPELTRRNRCHGRRDRHPTYALVLLAAPGSHGRGAAICLDRSRGTLTHMLLTDMSDAEIVLSRLAAQVGSRARLGSCSARPRARAAHAAGRRRPGRSLKRPSSSWPAAGPLGLLARHVSFALVQEGP